MSPIASRRGLGLRSAPPPPGCGPIEDRHSDRRNRPGLSLRKGNSRLLPVPHPLTAGTNLEDTSKGKRGIQGMGVVVRASARTRSTLFPRVTRVRVAKELRQVLVHPPDEMSSILDSADSILTLLPIYGRVGKTEPELAPTLSDMLQPRARDPRKHRPLREVGAPHSAV